MKINAAENTITIATEWCFHIHSSHFLVLRGYWLFPSYCFYKIATFLQPEDSLMVSNFRKFLKRLSLVM